MAAGEHPARLDTGRLASGVYVVMLAAGGERAERALTVARWRDAGRWGSAAAGRLDQDMNRLLAVDGHLDVPPFEALQRGSTTSAPP